MKFQEFIQTYPRFQKFNVTSCAQELFHFLSQPEIVDRMIIINDYGKLAPLDGIANEIENQFADKIELKSQLAARQMVGAMVKFVLGEYGYSPEERVSVKNSSIFKLAMRYKFVPQEQKMVLVRHITSEKKSSPKSCVKLSAQYLMVLHLDIISRSIFPLFRLIYQ